MLRYIKNIKYEGTFIGFNLNEKAKITYLNGCVYIGKVQNYLPHGEGKIVFTNKDVRILGYEHGKATYICNNGTMSEETGRE